MAKVKSKTSKPFKQQFLRKTDVGSLPFKKIGDRFILTNSIETPDYIHNKTGLKLDPYKEQVQLPFMMKLIDPSGNGNYRSLEDALKAGETKMFLKAGTYTLTQDHTLLANTTIQGENWNDVIINGDYKFLCSNADVILRDFTKKWANNNNNPTIDITAPDILIEHTKLTYTGSNAAAGCIKFANAAATDIRILNNIIDSTGTASGAGIVINGSGARSWVQNNHIISGFISISGANSLAKNNFLNNGTMIMSGDTSQTEGNYIVYTSGTGILFYSDYGNCVNNYVEGTATGYSSLNTQTQSFIGNSCKDTTGNGFDIGSSSLPGYGYTRIIGNTAYNPGGNGFIINTAVNDAKRLIISGNATYSATDDGFNWIGTGGNDCVISDNLADGCGGIGFNFYPGSGEITASVINSNTAVNNTNEGMKIKHDNCSIVGNILLGNSLDEIVDVNGGNSVVVTNQRPPYRYNLMTGL